MKKNALLMITSLLMVVGCKETKNEKSTILEESPTEIVNEQKQETVTESKFDINSLPESNKDIGSFPFYTVPDWIKTGGYSNERESDFDIFEFFTGEGFYPMEGRLSIVYFSEKQGEKWNEYKFMKTYTNHFEGLGVKKIWEGEKQKATPAADILTEKKGDSYIYRSTTQSLQENQIIYALKNKGQTIFIAVAANSAYGAIAVMQSGEFVQTVGILKADQIQKDLAEKGKAVLHILFDTDKATLKSEGKEAVAEIAKALNTDKSLKIVINGYTDNTGAEAHNLQLSKDRALAVLTALTNQGIDKTRLSSEGFGAKNPIASNDTEDGKSQNRRVELIKK